MNEKKRVGRPIKAGIPGERVQLSLRVTAETKTRLDAAALANGRSQSQEAEFRLEQTFRDDLTLGKSPSDLIREGMFWTQIQPFLDEAGTRAVSEAFARSLRPPSVWQRIQNGQPNTSI